MSKSLLRSTSVVSGMTMLSRVMGFARDMVFAYFFGAFGGFDAFIVAFKLPNFMRQLFAEGAFCQAFVPVLSEYRTKESPENVKLFLNNMAGALLSSLLLFTLFVEIIAPLVVIIFAPGFLHQHEQYTLAVSLLRVTFPYLIFISLTAFSGAILNTFESFAVPAFTPVLMNLCLIFSAVYLSQFFAVPVRALAWGVLLSGLVQLVFQEPFLYRKKLLPRPRWGWRDPGVRRVMKLMLPAMFGVSVAQVGVLIDTLFASFLVTGSISWLYYSQQLAFFPLGVFGVALATVVLPHLSRNHANNSLAEFNAAMNWAVKCVLVIAIPSMIGLMILSGPLTAALFLSGRFTIHDVLMSQRSLMTFSVGIPGFMLVKVFASGFYSRQDIKTPVRIAVISFVANVLLNCAFIYPLQHAGLALATSVASMLNAFLLFRKLHQQHVFIAQPGWLTFILRLLFANFVMALFLIFAVPSLSHWFEWTRLLRVAYILAWTGGAALVYLVSCYSIGLRMQDFRVHTPKLEETL